MIKSPKQELLHLSIPKLGRETQDEFGDPQNPLEITRAKHNAILSLSNYQSVAVTPKV